MALNDFNYADAKKASGNVAGALHLDQGDVHLHGAREGGAGDRRPRKSLEPPLAPLREARPRAGRARRLAGRPRADANVQFDEAMAAARRIGARRRWTKKRMDAANRLIGGLAGEQRAHGRSSSDAFADEIRRELDGRHGARVRLHLVRRTRSTPTSARCCSRAASATPSKAVPLTPSADVTKFMVDEAHRRRLGAAGAAVGRAVGAERHDGDAVGALAAADRPAGAGALVDPRARGGQRPASRAHREALPQRSSRTPCPLGSRSSSRTSRRSLDPVLDPSLDKAVQKSGRGSRLLADKVPVRGDLARPPVLKLANPHFSPELSAQVTVIDFTVTMDDPSSSRLGASCSAERAELEEQRQPHRGGERQPQRTLKRTRTTCSTASLTRRATCSTTQPDRGAAVDQDLSGRGAGEARGRRRRPTRASPPRATPAGGDARLAALLPDHRHGLDQPDVQVKAPAVPRALRLRPSRAPSKALLASKRIVYHRVPHLPRDVLHAARPLRAPQAPVVADAHDQGAGRARAS